MAISGHDRYTPISGRGLGVGGSGVAAAGWWLFSFTLGATVGAMTRRTLPAMAVTIAAYTLAVMAVFIVARDHYGISGPERYLATQLPVGARGEGGGWVGPDGREYAFDALPVCADAGREYPSCARDAGYRDVVYAYPPGEYWRFQWTEAGLLLLGAVVLGGACVYRVVRRPA